MSKLPDDLPQDLSLVPEDDDMVSVQMSRAQYLKFLDSVPMGGVIRHEATETTVLARKKSTGKLVRVFIATEGSDGTWTVRGKRGMISTKL